MKIIIIYIRVCLLTLFFSKLCACNFAAGSYPYAKVYKLKTNELSLIQAVKKFKKDNPEFIVPEQTNLKDGRNDDRDLWYHIYFYYSKENQIVYTWLRSTETGETSFALVSINDGLTLGNWREINKDFNNANNKEQIKKFETLILTKLKEELD